MCAMRWVAVLSVALTLSACGTSPHLPTLGGRVRPATWTNGDGSWTVGGLDGDGAPQTRGKVTYEADDIIFGHIYWAEWTPTEAIGWGVGWYRCLNVRGCPLAYTRDIKGGVIQVVATHPVAGQFRRFQLNPGPDHRRWCVIYPPSSSEFFSANCRDWKRSE